jgi:hypothetical protein
VIERSSSTARTIACTAAVLLAASCSTGATHEPGKTVTVTRPEPTGGAGTTTTQTSPPTTKPTRHVTKLPGTCDSMLPLAVVDTALGRAIKGTTAFVVGAAQPDIGRLTYLNCRYGLPAGSAADTATPKLEISISLYANATYASRRIPITVDDYASHGASESDITVNGVPAAILTMASGKGYADPTLVAASGQRTIAITLVETSGGNVTKDLTALAKVALQRSGG